MNLSTEKSAPAESTQEQIEELRSRLRRWQVLSLVCIIVNSISIIIINHRLAYITTLIDGLIDISATNVEILDRIIEILQGVQSLLR